MRKIVYPFSGGVVIYQNNKLSASIISQSGDKKVGGRLFTKNRQKLFQIPLFRGLVYLFYGLYLYLQSFFVVFSLEEEDENKKKIKNSTRKINQVSVYILLISGLLTMFLYGFIMLAVVPRKIYFSLFDGDQNYYFISFMIAILRVAIIYLSFLILRFCPFMEGIYSFNGAGNEFLHGKNDKKGYLYPLNFLNYLVNISLISVFVVSLVAINIAWYLNFLINALITMAIGSLCYEFLLFASNKDYPFLKDITFITNFLVSIRPNITNTEVLMGAKNELEYFQDFQKIDKGRIAMSSLYAEMQTKLKQSERFESSDLDWIIATFLGKSRTEIKLIRSVSQKEYRDIIRACDRRAKGEPLSNIFGFVEFYGLKFDVNKKVLSPRMETELLVEEALKLIKQENFKVVLDLCTGSGAIAIAIAKNSDCTVYGSDISKQALSLAQSNAEKNHAKVDFVHADLFVGLKKHRKYDIIVSNPPYIKTEDIEKLDIEVKKYDPKLALDGGEDGLVYYRKIISEAGKYLNKKGYLMFEVGKSQAEEVMQIMNEHNFQQCKIVKDYNGIERVVYGRYCK